MAGQFYRIEVKETGKMTAAFDLDPKLISVASLKLLVETETGLGPASQRLVCRGRILKDEDLLSAYIPSNDKSGVLSIFMNEVKREDDGPSQRNIVQPRTNSPDPRAKAFAPIANMMSKNPELLEKMFMSNPEVQAMVEKNPQLRQALSDPKTLQDMFHMSTNKSYYQEAMRGHDRALSNLENIPQGFQHLVQMQKTMKDAEGARSKGKPTKTSITGSEPRKEITTTPFPNPWQAKTPSFLRRANPFLPETDFMRSSKARKEDLAEFLLSSSIRPEDLDLPTESESEDEENGDQVDRMLDPSTPLKQSPTLSQSSDVSHYAARYHKQLALMRELGFTDENENIRALLKTGGNMAAAIEWLVSRKNL